MVVAIVLTGLIVCFHLARLVKAGGLWRDEAGAAALATLPAVKDVLAYFPHEAFPLLFPLTLRGYARIVGESDMAWRLFGTLVGVSIIGALWLNMRIVRRGVPLLSLAMLGFNGVFIQWGDSLRGYGLGILLNLLTLGLVWRMVERPTAARAVAAALAAVASVQCLFQNSFLLLAIGLSVLALALRRGAVRPMLLMVCVGIVAAGSLVPYWGPLRRAQDWDALIHFPVGLVYLWSGFRQALSAGGSLAFWIWWLLLALGLCAAAVGQFRGAALGLERESRDALLFSGSGVAFGVAGYLCFLVILSHPTQAWHYLALVALVAMFLDLIFDVLSERPWARAVRLTLVLLMAGAALAPTWRWVQVRQTNADLLAAKLAGAAGKDDFIVVTPWYFGITFNRYYTGPAGWTTIPPMSAHQFHRYDLVKAAMSLADQRAPVRPLEEQIADALRAGHRVWLAGGMELLPAPPKSGTLPPAPAANLGWDSDTYTAAWTVEVLAFLRSRARQVQEVRLEFAGPVYEFENLPLKVFEGWREPAGSGFGP